VKIAITMDADWAHDDILRYALDIVVDAGAAVTIFATHASPVWKEYSSDPRVEIGVHPNLNPTLEGQGRPYRTVLDEARSLIPAAKGIRAHSLTSNGPILDYASDLGFLYESNQYHPHPTTPFQNYRGLWRISQNWMDAEELYANHEMKLPSVLEQRADLVVLSFHPIHVFLNSGVRDHYESVRSAYQDVEVLRTRRNPGIGTESVLRDVLRVSDAKFVRMDHILA
jgi:hypothetical protein